MESPDGTIVSYSTQAGRTAEDGTGRNGPYTTAFLRHIEDKDDVSTVFHHISANVYETSKGAQLPELSLSFFGEFYLNGKMQINVASVAPVDPCSAAADHWKSAEAVGTIAAFEDHLARFPNCAFAGLAKARTESLKQAAAAGLTAGAVPPSSTSSASPINSSHLEAARLYKLAADRGDASAQVRLGSMYETGRGVPRNDAEAERLYKLAADQGNASGLASGRVEEAVAWAGNRSAARRTGSVAQFLWPTHSRPSAAMRRRQPVVAQVLARIPRYTVSREIRVCVPKT